MDSPPTPTVVIPLAVLKGETVTEGLVEFLSPVSVLLLGLVDIPDQTSSDQAREQFEDEAKQPLDTIAERFEAAGADVETRLAFTHDPQVTVEQVATDITRSVILFPAPMTTAERLVVAVSERINVPHIASTVAALVMDRDTEVTVYHAVEDGDAATEGERAVTGISRALAEAAIDRSRITIRIEPTDSAIKSVAQIANRHDIAVFGEEEPTLQDRIFGETSEQLAERVTVPVLLVRRPPDE